MSEPNLSDVALHVLQAVAEFEPALHHAQSVERANEIRRQIMICQEVLGDLESLARSVTHAIEIRHHIKMHYDSYQAKPMKEGS